MGLILTGQYSPQFLAGGLRYDALPTDPLSGTVNNLAVSNSSQISSLKLITSAPVTLTGIDGGTPDRQLLLINEGSFTITLSANSGSSLAINRFAAASTLNPGNTLQLTYSDEMKLWLVAAAGGGSSGVTSLSATAPITVSAAIGAVTVGIDQTGIVIAESQVTNLVSDLNTLAAAITLISSGAGPIIVNAPLTPAALASGTTNNYNPTNLLISNVLRLTPNAAGSNLGGLAAASNGQEFIVVNIGSALLTLLHQGGGSTPANRFICPGGTDFSLVGDGTCTVWYDGASAAYRVMA